MEELTMMMVTKTRSTRRRRHNKGDRRSALRSARGESELTLLKGVSSSSVNAPSLENLHVREQEEPVLDRRTKLAKGESSTKLLQGISSSETTSSSVTNTARQSADRHRIIARAASLFPARNVQSVEKKKKKKLRPQEKLDDVVPPEFIYIPTNTHVPLYVIGEQPPEIIRI